MKRLACGALAAAAALALPGCPDTDLPGGKLSGTVTCPGELMAAFRAASTAAVRDDLWIAFVDVGQGDGIWIRTPGERESSAREIIVDAGDNGSFDRSNGGDAMIQFMTENEWPPGSPIDYLIVTNPDQDHYGGAQALLFGPKAYDVRAYSDPGSVSEGAGYNTFIGDVNAAAGLDVLRPARTTLPQTFSRWSSGLLNVTLLAADEAARTDNGVSLVMRLDYSGLRILLTGDIEGDTLETLAATRPADLRANVLKVAHHGSKNNSPDAFLNAVFPPGSGEISPDRYAIFPVGPGNTYGHPDPNIVEKVAEFVGLRGIYRTDRGDAGKSLTSGPGDDHILMHITPDGRLTVCYAYPDTPAPAQTPQALTASDLN